VKSKIRYIPLVVLGTVILSLMAIIPAFSATGEIEFYIYNDTDEEQTWTKQGGLVGIRLDDPDLDVAEKRVIIPGSDADIEDSTTPGTNDGEVTFESGATMVSTTNTDLGMLVAEGDTILVAGFTVREVTEVVAVRTDTNSDQVVDDTDDITSYDITVNVPFGKSATDADLYLVRSVLLNTQTPTGITYDDCPNCALAELLTGDRGRLSGFPIDSGLGIDLTQLVDRVDGQTDDFVLADDIRFVNSNGTSYDIADTLLPNGQFTGGSNDDYAQYWAAVPNNTRSAVTVTSDVDGVGLTIVLTETKHSSGIFEAVLNTGETSTTTAMVIDGTRYPLTLAVGKDDTITVDYNDPDSGDNDVEATLPVESTPPTFANFTPAHGFSSKLERPEVEADITDAASGLGDDSTLYVIFATDDGGNGKTIRRYRRHRVENDGSTSSITSGFHVRQDMHSSLKKEDATIYWWVEATDDAGNVGVSDRMPQDSDGEPDDCDPVQFAQLFAGDDGTNIDKKVDVSKTAIVHGCQPFKITADNTAPKLVGAFAGQFWDLDIELPQDNDDVEGDDDRTNYNVNSADPTSIRLQFDEALDGSTVSADDFEVDGDTPLAAEHFEGASKSVFLTVPSLDPDDRPEVKMIAEVRDAAGNRRTTGTIKAATDKIAPTLEVMIEGTAGGDRPVTDDVVTVTIVSDESISAPTVEVYLLGADNETATTTLMGAHTTKASPVKGEARTYSARIDRPEVGLYNVVVKATDVAGGSNEASTGATKHSVDTSGDSSALLYELDTAVADMTVTPMEIDDPNAFITLDFTAEGNEYPTGEAEDADDVDYDTHASVTIVSAMLGDLDITDSLAANSAGNKFLYKASDLEIGKHDIVVEAMDEAGNEQEFEVEIEITERAPFSLTLNPGWNLVSIPSPPANGAINTVIPADHPADTVLTYDPLVPGGWLTAVRGGDGNFTGTLTMITATRAYWIHTDSFEALDVDIPKPSIGQAVFLPTITISKGWNLIPALDVDGDEEVGTAKHYFRSISDDVAAAYRFDTVLNSWLSVDLEGTSATEDDSEMIERGRGYWLYATKAGTLVP
jgi:hypothetical protein